MKWLKKFKESFTDSDYYKKITWDEYRTTYEDQSVTMMLGKFQEMEN